jgi:hypothetical protein
LCIGAVSDESFRACSEVMSALEQTAMCNNKKLIRKMEKGSQECKKVENLSSEMRTTLRTIIYSNKILTQKKKFFQETK